MKATEILMGEHRVIERVLDALESAAKRLEGGSTVRPGFFVDAADFIKGFADGCHHHKEEDVLFGVMADNGIPVEGGPIGVMLQEHEQARAFTRAMRAGAEKLESGDSASAGEVVSNALGYVELLRQHIVKEDTILFPMADQAIPVEAQDQVEKDFQRVEHEEVGPGVHEKYLALADKLETEASGE